MKIRNGFVSNSSSSSFVFAYDSYSSKIPENVEELTDDMTLEVGGSDYESIFIKVTEELREYLRNKPSQFEKVNNLYKGFKELSDCFEVDESLVGKVLEVQVFGHDSSTSYVADYPEEAFEENE